MAALQEGSAGPSPAGLLPPTPLFSALSLSLSADDHSRVRLLVLDGDPHSDYINANYIDVRVFMGLGGWALGPVTAGSRWMAVPQTLPHKVALPEHVQMQLA